MTYPPYGGPAHPPGDQPPSGQPPSQPAPPPGPPPYGQPPAPASGQPGFGQPVYGPPPGQGHPGDPISGQPYAGQPGPPVSGQPYPGQPGVDLPPPGYPAYGPPPPAKKKRGLLIASLVLAVVLLLCGGGATSAFLLLRNAETGEGAAEPVVAVESFLKAVYTEKDAQKAAALVCSESREEQEIVKKVEEIKGYAEKYKTPRFKWDKPTIDEQNEERAIVSVKLDLITADEKTASQQLRFTVVQKTGWWVCEVDG